MAVSSRPPQVTEVLTSDPLSAVTRKERGKLFIVSLVSFIVSRGLLPTEITSLGLEFNTQEDRLLLYAIVLAIQVYFLFGFVMYLAYDLVNWYSRIREAINIHYSFVQIDFRLLNPHEHANTRRQNEIRISELEESLSDLSKRKQKQMRSWLENLIAESAQIKSPAQVPNNLQSDFGDFNTQVRKYYLRRETIRLIYGRTAIVRVVFDLVLPLIVGSASTFLLLKHVCEV